MKHIFATSAAAPPPPPPPHALAVNEAFDSGRWLPAMTISWPPRSIWTLCLEAAVEEPPDWQSGPDLTTSLPASQNTK